jgi:hypothetical protein
LGANVKSFRPYAEQTKQKAADKKTTPSSGVAMVDQIGAYFNAFTM